MKETTFIRTSIEQISALNSELSSRYENLSPRTPLQHHEYVRGELDGVRMCARILETLVKAYNHDLKKGN